MFRVPLLALTLTALLGGMLPAAGHEPITFPYRDGDQSVVARNILPPGQGGYMNTADFASVAAGQAAQPGHYTDQIDLYESLVAQAPGLTDDDAAEALFKDASFGVEPGDEGRTYFPRHDVTVVRDLSYNVPHVYGETRAGTMYGAGYVSAEDRMFMMDVLRHLSRGRLSELLGASEANVAADRAQRLVADYTEEELQAMADRVEGLHPELGPLAKADLTNFVDGVNAYIQQATLDPRLLPAEYAALQIVPRPWKLTDSVALSTLIGGTFSVGGGGQIANDVFLDALENAYSPAEARRIFDDFRAANDPEAPTATSQAFPFNDAGAPVDPAAVARPDNKEVATQMRALVMPEAVDGPFGKIKLLQPQPASNALLIGPGHSTTGRPMTVFGPQVGYYSPEILMEIDLHGPGVHARGAAFPGISLYVLLGRGAGYGWSATTAIGDHTDIRAVKLCEPGGAPAHEQSEFYLRDGVCHAMYSQTEVVVAKPSAGGVPGTATLGDEVVIQHRTQRVKLGDPEGRASGLGDLPIGPEWAIVVARGTVDGDPVAFVRQRSSYGIEVDATLTYTEIHDPARISDIDDLITAFDRFSFSFNWHLITKDAVGFYTTGRYPVLADGVDPDLPFWGDSEWDWQRFLTRAEHPQAVNPSSGFIANWNNKQAPRFRAADDWFGYSSVGRVELLSDGTLEALQGDGKVSPAELVRVMGIAATQDVRGRYVLPEILSVLGTPGDPDLSHAAGLLADWVASGAHRRDLDGNGRYEHAAAVAVMDALWTPALKAAFGSVLGDAFAAVPLPHDNGAGPGGSAYLGGWYGQLEKDLRQVQGEPVDGAFGRTYCGGGSFGACQSALEQALADAVSAVKARYGTAVSAWGADLKSRDAIQFSAVGVQGQRSMHWQNRPTFQQLLEFGD